MRNTILVTGATGYLGSALCVDLCRNHNIIGLSLWLLWSKPVVGRMLPGQGNSGFPYTHRKDVVKIVRSIIDMDDCLDRFEIFCASQPG